MHNLLTFPHLLNPVLATYFHGCTLYLLIINQSNSSTIPFQTLCFPTNTFLLSRLLSLIQLPDFNNPLIHQYLQSTDTNTFLLPSFLWYLHFPLFPPLNSTVHHYDHFFTQSYKLQSCNFLSFLLIHCILMAESQAWQARSLPTLCLNMYSRM